MNLSTDCSQMLLKRFGCYANESCDKCGRLLGPVRYTRSGENGAWCSRECRDGKEAHPPGTCIVCGASLSGLRRGTRFCSDVCRKRENRKSQTCQNSRDQRLKTLGLRGGLNVLAMATPSASQNAPDSEFGKVRS